MGDEGQMVIGIHWRHGWKGEETAHCVCYNDRDNPEDWVWDNRENGEGSWVAYMVFWKAWTVVEQGVSGTPICYSQRLIL